MSRIKTLFQHKQQRVLNVYCTAGYPQLQSTLPVMQALQGNGADIIELGMPYSDPLADGPIIQASNKQALDNGMSIDFLFQQLKDFRKHINIPVILMGYINPVMQYGFEKFCAAASEVGIDGLILPDLPPYEFEKEYKQITEEYGLDIIFLVTPQTTDERIKLLDSLSTGFLYAVSSAAVTGKDIDENTVINYLQRLQSLNLSNPVLTGFGIKDKQSFNAVCKHSNGAVIGSAYIKALQNSSDIEATTATFLSTIL